MLVYYLEAPYGNVIDVPLGKPEAITQVKVRPPDTRTKINQDTENQENDISSRSVAFFSARA
eukprot:1742391-Pyramimonas_sp.AAC.1